MLKDICKFDSRRSFLSAENVLGGSVRISVCGTGFRMASVEKGVRVYVDVDELKHLGYQGEPISKKEVYLTLIAKGSVYDPAVWFLQTE